MPELIPANRLQMEFCSLEKAIEKDNPVRFIDRFGVPSFVDKLELDKLNFQIPENRTEGFLDHH